MRSDTDCLSTGGGLSPVGVPRSPATQIPVGSPIELQSVGVTVAAGFRTAFWPLSVIRSLLRSWRYSLYVPLRTRTVSPGLDRSMAAWMDCPGWTVRVVAPAGATATSRIASATADAPSIRVIRDILPRLSGSPEPFQGRAKGPHKFGSVALGFLGTHAGREKSGRSPDEHWTDHRHRCGRRDRDRGAAARGSRGQAQAAQRPQGAGTRDPPRGGGRPRACRSHARGGGGTGSAGAP